MRDVAVVAYARTPPSRGELERNETEMLAPVIREALESAGLKQQEIGFTVSGSSDFLAGQPFAFVLALDAVGAWPPIRESHVEMDGAWALYEAWVRLQCGDIDTALVYAFGKSSLGSVRDVLSLQLDPYYVQPLHPDSIAVAALQARAMIDAGMITERDMASIAVRANAAAGVTIGDIEDLLAQPCIASPLRRHDCPPVNDAAAAVILAAGDAARRACRRPAWITGIDHRAEPHGLGMRDLSRSPSTEFAGERAGAFAAPVDVAELHAPFSHQQTIVAGALRLQPAVRVNPSGGALADNPVMVAGLIRVGETARRLMEGDAGRALAHATSGPCLQQNLVCVMETRGAGTGP